MHMKVVFICQDPYPYSGACSSLIKKMLCAGFKTEMMDIHIIASSCESSSSSTTMEVDGITVHRVWWWKNLSLQTVMRSFIQYPIHASIGLIVKLRSKLLHKVSDGFCFDKNTVRQIVNCLQRIRCSQNDVIIPVAGLYETVQAALEWKKRHGSRVLVYQVDPCSTNQAYSDSSKKKRTDFEISMYETADCVITTPIIMHEMRSVLAANNLSKTIPMEFPNLEVAKLNDCAVPPKTGSEIQCVFSGMVYKNVRNPKLTISLFGALEKCKVRLSMVGVSREDAQKYIDGDGIKSNIVFHGYVPADECQNHIDKADILVNIGNSVLNQVPSKLFTYIATGKPIVNICVSRQCPTIEYLRKYPLSINIFQDEEYQDQIEKLENFILDNIGKTVPSEVIKENFYTCSAEYCSTLMKQTILKLMESALR